MERRANAENQKKKKEAISAVSGEFPHHSLVVILCTGVPSVQDLE
jgi:hypothetical protein